MLERVNEVHSSAKNIVPLGLLILIAFSGTFGMHIFVPALPQVADALHTDSQTVQLTITIYILGLAIGQLIYGPVSDAIGRRPAVFAALTIYLIGSLLAFYASSVPFLVAARLLQSLGGAGGITLTRAIVGDTAQGADATRRLALLNLLLLVGPGLAPVLGATTVQWLGWRAIFAVLAAMVFCSLLLSLRYLPETTTPSRKLACKSIAFDLASFFHNRKFMKLAVAGSLGSTGCYAYFVSAPFILSQQLGLSLSMVGYCVGGTLIAASLGTLSARYFAGRAEPHIILISAAALATLTGLLFLLFAWREWLTPLLVVGLSSLIMYCAGILSTTALGAALAEAKERKGSAAGIFGSFQMTSGALCTSMAGLFSNHAVGCGIVLTLAYGICLFLFVVQKKETDTGTIRTGSH